MAKILVAYFSANITYFETIIIYRKNGFEIVGKV
jgi:hypothetical protein